MCQKYTADELNSMNHETKNRVICDMQERLDKVGNFLRQKWVFLLCHSQPPRDERQEHEEHYTYQQAGVNA